MGIVSKYVSRDALIQVVKSGSGGYTPFVIFFKKDMGFIKNAFLFSFSYIYGVPIIDLHFRHERAGTDFIFNSWYLDKCFGARILSK